MFQLLRSSELPIPTIGALFISLVVGRTRKMAVTASSLQSNGIG
jgi:hypothetical protein